jgi:hypothetical protein
MAGAILLTASVASADAVTDWNEYTIKATKGFNGSTGAGVFLDTNLGTRVSAIQARAVFDAVNSIKHFSPGNYYYKANNTGSAAAAVAQASHDVLLAQLPDPTTDPSADSRWSQTRAWVDSQLNSDLAALGVTWSDGGVAAGKAAAAAANQARRIDHGSPVTSYGEQLTPFTNPGIGLWRQSNAVAVYINPVTGAPTGFDASGTVIQPRSGIDLNWRDVTPFSISTRQKAFIVASTPLFPAVGSAEYALEAAWERKKGRDSASSTERTPDQTAQALYYKQDTELYVTEAARIASKAYGLSLEANTKLFAVLSNALADSRLAAYATKYEQKFWRPITAFNANADGSVTNNYSAWRPLAATPSHPGNTSGHSAAGAAGYEILRSYFGDKIRPDGAAVTLGTLPWLVGTNAGTGNVTTRTVSTFTQAQLENGASRLYLGVHFGYDNLQGQLVGLAVADAIILRSDDPAAAGLRIRESPGSLVNITSTLLKRPELYGIFGKSTTN